MKMLNGNNRRKLRNSNRRIGNKIKITGRTVSSVRLDYTCIYTPAAEAAEHQNCFKNISEVQVDMGDDLFARYRYGKRQLFPGVGDAGVSVSTLL